MSNGYNGWSNYETWKTNLEVLDGYDVSDFMGAHRFVFPDDRDEAVEKLASHFREYVEGAIGIIYEAFTYGIVEAFINRVDFDEIAEHYVDDYITEFMYDELKEINA